MNTELYDLLGVQSDATTAQIKKAYRKMALKWHPDKHACSTPTEKQDAEKKFREISEAYEILCDANKRQTYDRFGKDAVMNSNGPNFNSDVFQDIFKSMGGAFPFMNGFNRRNAKTEIKFPDLEHTIVLDMKDIYMGSSYKFEVTRYNIKENMTPRKEDIICSKCNGNGRILKTVQMGPGMFTQSQEVCHKCQGHGIIFNDTFFVKSVQKFARSIPKGIFNGKKIVVEDQGHELPECYKSQYPGQDRSNLVLIISENRNYKIDDYTYMRGVNGDPFDLRLDLNIYAHEAICGTYKNITFVNGKKFSIKLPPNVLFSHGDKAIVVPNMGMPYHKQKNTYGNLYVVLHIKDKLDESKLSQVWKVLTGTDMKKYSDKVLKQTNNEFINAMTLDAYKDSDAYKQSERNKMNFAKNNEDDVDDDDTNSVGCAHQ